MRADFGLRAATCIVSRRPAQIDPDRTLAMARNLAEIPWSRTVASAHLTSSRERYLR
jgi:hypothetical protein